MGINIQTIFDLALSYEDYYKEFGVRHPLDKNEEDTDECR